MSNDKVKIRHPKSKGPPVKVPRRSFENVWKTVGWVLADDKKNKEK